jgi:hypothetical protein
MDRCAYQGRSRIGLYLAATAASVLAIVAAFVALTIMALVGGLLAAGAGCETGAETALPLGAATVLAATVYSDSGPGAYGAGLAGHAAFAELGLWSVADGDRAHADRIGVALGLGHPLAPYTRLQITAPNGRTVIAEKRDVGMGGPAIDGHPRAIDLWTSTREALGLPSDWSGLVRVMPTAHGALATEAGSVADGAEMPPAIAQGGCAAAAVPASEAGGRIVAIARSQLGVGEHPPGSNCTPYGPCEPWCALFTTWVWRRAGVHVPSLGFSGAVYEWAARRARVHPPSSRPQPGWAALFGSGPATPASSLHVAIVESVLAHGEITLINGNFANSVLRTGPCEPARAAQAGSGGCEEPGPIYAYAAPE